jgi:hypothetical protein
VRPLLNVNWSGFQKTSSRYKHLAVSRLQALSANLDLSL